MLSHRPYRSAYHPEDVIYEITANRGLTYDPQVVDCCADLLREKFQLPKK